MSITCLHDISLIIFTFRAVKGAVAMVRDRHPVTVLGDAHGRFSSINANQNKVRIVCSRVWESIHIIQENAKKRKGV